MTLITQSPAHVLIALSPLLWGTALYIAHRNGQLGWDSFSALAVVLTLLPLAWLFYAFVLALNEAVDAVKEFILSEKVQDRSTEER